MAVPTYDELLECYDMEKSIMEQTFDMWETLAKFLEMPDSDIVNIKSQGDAKEQRCWNAGSKGVDPCNI